MPTAIATNTEFICTAADPIAAIGLLEELVQNPACDELQLRRVDDFVNAGCAGALAAVATTTAYDALKDIAEILQSLDQPCMLGCYNNSGDSHNSHAFMDYLNVVEPIGIHWASAAVQF